MKFTGNKNITKIFQENIEILKKNQERVRKI